MTGREAARARPRAQLGKTTPRSRAEPERAARLAEIKAKLSDEAYMYGAILRIAGVSEDFHRACPARCSSQPERSFCPAFQRFSFG